MRYSILSRVGLLIILISWPATEVIGQESPYTGMEGRSIKALSSEQVEGYLKGEGMTLALPAELNGYPGPRHVLDMAEELALGEAQQAAVSEVFRSMQENAIELGRELVAAEGRLDSLFASGSIDEGSLEEAVLAAGMIQAKLRLVHLAAHLETTALMSSEQVAGYQHLRGYSSQHEKGHEGHH